jgi:hypothetical protein
MVDETVDALLACRSEQDFWRVHQKAEALFTPLEIAGLAEHSHSLPTQSKDWLDKIIAYAGLDRAAPQRFLRWSLAPDIDVYRDPSVPTDRKPLILGFCGGADRLMMPIPCVLQYLPSDLCDLVLLRDSSHQHYLNGISSYASSFHELVRKLAADLSVDLYRRTCCYGTSMGGFSALRRGILLRSDSAVSVGGGFPWHPSRLLRRNERALSSFDPLCRCNAATSVSLYCCYGAGHPHDPARNEYLSRILPIHRIAVDTTSHNVIVELWRLGALQAFYARVFAFQEHCDSPAQGRTTATCSA